MKNITLNKIGSVTKNAHLKEEVCISPDIYCEEGAIIAAEVLEDKQIYNKLELVSGRMSTLHKGDIIAVALGNRRALKGFVGDVPKSLQPNDIIHLLNMGGVAGVCISENVEEVGHALSIRVLGAIANEVGNLNIADYCLSSPANNLVSKTPLILVSGTCMNVGKTTVASELIKHLSRADHTVFGAKLAGVAALRDTESMRDHGAKKVLSLSDAGCTSSVLEPGLATTMSKGVINTLAKDAPDCIVIEFGDGLLGEYGVLEILSDPEIQELTVAHIGCAHDPIGALKLAEICEEIGAPLNVMSGPVTDNSVGCNFVTKQIGIPAYNALTHGEVLSNSIQKICLKL